MSLSFWSIWPRDFPTDCPPEEAARAEGVYYRLAKNNPPEQSDFESLYSTNHARAERIAREGGNKCQTMGLSVYTKFDHAVHRAKAPGKIGRNIVRLVLTRGPARVAPTGGGFDSHHTLWVPEGFDLTQYSQVIHTV